MNRKQLTILIVAGVVICGLGLYFYKSNNQSWEASGQKLGQKVIKDFPMNEVERITVKQAQGELNLAKKNDTWAVHERSDYPANFSNISEFLRKVWELKLAQPVKVGPSQLARLELGPPDKGTNTGTVVEFKDKSGKTINSLVLGKKHMKESPGGDAGMGGGGWPDGRYVMPDGEGGFLFSLSTNVTLAAETTSRLTLLQDVPCVSPARDGFGAMVACAKSLVGRLDATIVDDSNQPLSDGALDEIASQVLEFYKEMDASDIPAGSTRALRLFC